MGDDIQQSHPKHAKSREDLELSIRVLLSTLPLLKNKCERKQTNISPLLWRKPTQWDKEAPNHTALHLGFY